MRMRKYIKGAQKAGLVLLLVLPCLASCSPRIITEKEVVIEYRDRVVHDTATVEIPKIVEKNVTRDTTSHLENKYAESDAMVSEGLLYHFLSSRPQIIKVPVEVHVTDTLYKESEIVYQEVPVEQPLSWWKKFRMDAFLWLLGAVVLLLLWTFRKLIF